MGNVGEVWGMAGIFMEGYFVGRLHVALVRFGVFCSDFFTSYDGSFSDSGHATIENPSDFDEHL